jgi:hypothetical protein
MKHFCLLIVGLSFLCSCSGTGSRNMDNIIDVESAVGTGKICNASEFIKEIKYISLETSPNSMVGNIRKIIINGGEMYIGDDKGVIKIFDLNGHYLSSFSKVGRGPEEYASMTEFEIAPNGHIFVVSQGEGIIEYDDNFKFIRRLIPEKSEDAGFRDITLLKEGLFASNKLYFSIESGSMQTWNIYDDSLNTHFSCSVEAISRTVVGGGENRSPFVVMKIIPYRYYMFDNTLNLYRQGNGNDTIFNIDIENSYRKSARYIAYSGKYHFLSEMESGMDVNVSALEAISLSDVIECDDYLFMEFQFRGLAPEPFETGGTDVLIGNGEKINVGGEKNSWVYGVYNKNSGKLSLLNQPIPQKFGLKNDINNGAPFWPKSITKTQELISWYNALELITLAEEGKIDQSIVANLKEDDNPVVVIAVPK